MVELNLSAMKQNKPHEYAMRFVFGGLCSMIAGMIADHYGPVVGGLFLAFPAIFPAGASLIESHEKKRKAAEGFDGTNRGRIAASVDAAGASLGCVGLLGFALVLWLGLPGHNAVLTVATAAAVWMLVSFGLWELRKRRMFARHAGAP